MAYIGIPRDLEKIKSRFALGMTGPQILHVLAGAAIGVPLFFLARGPLGNGPAMLALFASVAPFAFLALYEKDGQPARKWLYLILRHMIYPARRIYRTQNFYGKIYHLIKEESIDAKQKTNAGGAKRAPCKQRQGCKGQQKRPEKRQDKRRGRRT